MYLGYNTNGLAHHGLLDAIELLADIGYGGVAITIDHHALNPRDPGCRAQLAAVREALRRHGLRCVIETGARFLLDPRCKHEPTLVSPEPERRRRRLEFLQHSVSVAEELESDCVSLFAGVVRDDCSREEALERLRGGLLEILELADRRGVTLAFEPEPGMLVDTMDSFDALLARLDGRPLKLTLDVGHLHCLGEAPPAEVICKYRDLLVNVHLEDTRAGVHEHLMFGEGEMDFPPIFAALKEIGYEGGVFVELSRHSHMAPEAARRSIELLEPML